MFFKANYSTGFIWRDKMNNWPIWHVFVQCHIIIPYSILHFFYFIFYEIVYLVYRCFYCVFLSRGDRCTLSPLLCLLVAIVMQSPRSAFGGWWWWAGVCVGLGCRGVWVGSVSHGVLTWIGLDLCHPPSTICLSCINDIGTLISVLVVLVSIPNDFLMIYISNKCSVLPIDLSSYIFENI